MSVLGSCRTKYVVNEARSHWDTGGSLSDPEDWLLDALGAAPASTGQRINRKTVTGHTPAFRALQLITGDVARVPLHTLKRTPTGGKERAITHAAYPLLRYNASPHMTALTFRRTMQGHALLLGNAYALILRTAAGAPSALIILDPESSHPVRADGQLWYVTTMNGEMIGQPDLGTRQFKFDWSEILHIRGLGFDGLVGYNIVKVMRDAFAPGVAARDFGARFFANNARPSTLLEVPGTLKPANRKILREGWEAMYRGVDNAWRTAILDRGITAKTLSISAKNSQLLELRKMDLIDVANIFSIPRHKLGDDSGTSYNSLEQENRAYLQDTLEIWLKEWESECRNKLLTEAQKRNDSHVIEFLREDLIAIDTATKTESIDKQVNGGTLTLDQANAMMNRPTVGGKLGRSYRIQKGFEMVDPEQDREDDQDTIEFVRDVLGSWASHPTIGPVLFNLTKTDDLLAIAGLPTEPDRIEPWLPVLTPAGQLVSGETYENEAGETVGGIPFDDEPAEPAEDPDASGDVSEGDDAGESVEDLDDDRARELYAAVQEWTPRKNELVRMMNAHKANEDALRDAADRMAGRLIVKITRAAQKPDTFVAKVESFCDDLVTITEALGPPCRAYLATDRDDAALKAAAWLVRAAYNSALSASECKPGQLKERVEQWAKEFGTQAPGRLVRALQGA